MKWIEDMPEPAARALANRLEALPGNPSRHETRIRGARMVDDPDRITPRFARLVNEDGTLDVGIPEDGWSEPAVRADSPGLSIVDMRGGAGQGRAGVREGRGGAA